MDNVLIRGKRSFYITGTLFLGYILLLNFFNVVDVYHQHFFENGWLVCLYNFMRLSFIFYFFWLFYAAGDQVLKLIAKDYDKFSSKLESFLLAFLTGCGAWHIFLFLLGLASLYHRTLVSLISMGLFVISLPKLHAWIADSLSQRALIYWPGCLLISLPLFLFMITKGLYPTGGHDYFNHYFPYLRTVIDNGNIFPNEVWYHFYYSKGAGLYFLSMLLTDPLAPQLATTAMVMASAAMIFSILKQQVGAARIFPWLGVALYFAFFIYTPGPIENMREGGWGDLEKQHEPAAVLMMATIWVSIGLWQVQAQQKKFWGTALLFTVCALVFISHMMAFFSGMYLGCLSLLSFVYKQKKAALWMGGGALIAVMCLIFLWAISYFLTGLPDDQSLFLIWPMINFEKINQWGTLFNLLLQHWEKAMLVAAEPPFSWKYFLKILVYLRLDIWFPLIILGVTTGCAALFLQKRIVKFSHSDILVIVAIGGFLLEVAVLSLFIGRDQPISFYRFTSFTYAPMLCFSLILLAIGAGEFFIKRSKYFWIIFIIFIFSLQWRAAAIENYHYHDNFSQVVKHGFRFFKGNYSIAGAYQHQEGWAGRMEWGAIYPAAEIVWKQLPPKTRIWSMHIHSYCMLPDCHMEGYHSFSFSPHMGIVLFGDPIIAKEWLKKEKLNYFFFSKSLRVEDVLPLSPLFSPDHIADYLGIVWMDNDSSLLTWKENSYIAIDAAWLVNYRKSVNASKTLKTFPYNSIRKLMDKFENQTGKQIKVADLSWA